MVILYSSVQGILANIRLMVCIFLQRKLICDTNIIENSGCPSLALSQGERR